MKIIQHRINTIEQLRRVPPEHGVEIDLRDYDGEIRLVHDPLAGGDRLADWLAAYRHGPIIFNVKCDGLVERVLALAKKQQVADYFFLDLANPTLVNLARQGFRHMAVRYSEYEPLEFALAFAGLVDWVWVDCFTRLPLTPESYHRLKQHFKLCLVSPELQGFPRAMIGEFRQQLQAMPVDAVCTDFPDDWQVA